jgi:hypothetical protein
VRDRKICTTIRAVDTLCTLPFMLCYALTKAARTISRKAAKFRPCVQFPRPYRHHAQAAYGLQLGSGRVSVTLSLTLSAHRPFGTGNAMAACVQDLLQHKEDLYGGVIVDADHLPHEEDAFKQSLEFSLKVINSALTDQHTLASQHLV